VLNTRLVVLEERVARLAAIIHIRLVVAVALPRLKRLELSEQFHGI
jgi:hypothetical protein